MSLALRFTASQNDYVEEAGGHWDFNAAYTWQGWVMPVSVAATAGGWVMNISNGDGFDQVRFAGGGNVGKLTAQVQATAGTTTTVVGSTVLVDGQFVHIEIVREDATVFKVYLNAAASPEITVSQATTLRTTPSATLTMGYGADCRMAHARVNTVALNQAQRLADKSNSTSQNPTGLWADWPFQSHT